MIKHNDPIRIIVPVPSGSGISNLISPGYHNLIVYRQRNLPFRTLGIWADQVRVITDFGQVEALRPNVAFITSPTAQQMLPAI